MTTMSRDIVQDTLRDVCRRDPPALDALAKVEVGPVGAPEGNQNAARTTSDIVTNCSADNDRGNSATYTMRRLAKVETAQGYRGDFHNNIMDVPGDNPQGTSATYTMRRLPLIIHACKA